MSTTLHTWPVSQMQSPIAIKFNPLPSEAILMLAKFQTFQGLLSIFQSNSRTFRVF